MKKRSWREIIFDIFIFVLICIFSYFLANRIINLHGESDRDVPKINSNKTNLRTPLEITLFRKNSLNNKPLLKGEKSIKLADNVHEFIKNQFKGSYIGIKNNKILFSGGGGYANARTKTVFKLNSSFSVGNYQDFLNNAILIRMSQEDKLKLNKRLNSYLPNLSTGNMKVKTFLKSKSKFYIKRDNFKKINKNNKINLKSFKNSPIGSNYIRVDQIMKEMLISKVAKLNYEESMNEWLNSKMNLTDTRVYSIKQKQANDVIGYSYHSKNGKKVQSSTIKEGQRINGVAPLKMSMTDILIANYKILNNDYFGRKFNKLFYTMNNVANLGSEFTNNGYKLRVHSSGQYLYLNANLNGSKIALVAANYPNKNLTGSMEVETLFNLME